MTKKQTNMSTFRKGSLSCLFVLLIPSSEAWIYAPRLVFKNVASTRNPILHFSDNKIDNNDFTELPAVLETDDPCWQNMLDDDCSMGNIYAANFVAGKWIKSMPCGQGIEDCDMPTGLSAPDARPEAGVDHVDVMKFLGLKRAESLQKSVATKESDHTTKGENNHGNTATNSNAAP